jgi:hypothetical protein
MSNQIQLSELVADIPEIYIVSNDSNATNTVTAQSTPYTGSTPTPSYTVSTPSPPSLMQSLHMSLHITEQDSYILYTFPGGMFPLTTSDFTLNLWYKTVTSSEVQQPVAIFSNVRDTPDANAYGRHFMLMLQPTGRVSLEFSAGDFDQPDSTTNSHGRVETHNRIDDMQWHQVNWFNWNAHTLLMKYTSY